MWGAWALVAAWNSGAAGRIAAVSLLAIYVSVEIPVGRATTISFYNRSQAIHKMLESIVQQSRDNPGKTILLTGVEPDLFWSALYHRPLRLYGIEDVYVLPDGAAALRENRAVVYDLSSGEARDVTTAYHENRNLQR